MYTREKGIIVLSNNSLGDTFLNSTTENNIVPNNKTQDTYPNTVEVTVSDSERQVYIADNAGIESAITHAMLSFTSVLLGMTILS